MGTLELISRSFCSKLAKRYLKSLNIRDAYITVDLRMPLYIEFCVNDGRATIFVSENNGVMKAKISIDKGKNSESKIFDVTSGCLNFTERDYVLHFMDVLIVSNPNISVVYGAEGDHEDLHSLLVDIPIFDLRCYWFQAPSKMLQRVLNNIDSFQMRGHNQSHTSVHQIFTKNFDELVLMYPIIDLNGLLLLQSPVIKIESIRITVSDMNLFLKLWIRGCISKNLKYLNMMDINVKAMKNAAICKGIDYITQPWYKKRTFAYSDPTYRCCAVIRDFRGGYNIQSDDGTKATLYRDHCGFHFMVWD